MWDHEAGAVTERCATGLTTVSSWCSELAMQRRHYYIQSGCAAATYCSSSSRVASECATWLAMAASSL